MVAPNPRGGGLEPSRCRTTRERESDMNKRTVRHALAFIASVVGACLALAGITMATASADPPSTSTVQASEIGTFDPTGVEWRDDATGEIIDSPISMPAPGPGESSSGPDISPFAAYRGTCSGTNYKVIFTMPFDPETKELCYNGMGLYYLSAGELGNFSRILGVCPRSVGGQIRYRTYQGSRNWSTLRKASSSKTCYYFADSGFNPVSYDVVNLVP